MHILQVFNRRSGLGGEDLSIEDTARILAAKGHFVSFLTRDVRELETFRFGRARAFFSGIYSLEAARRARNIIKHEHLDVVHAHNLYPLISPSVLREFSRSGIATIWHPHDQRPICATGLSLHQGMTCERCTGGRDYWCVLLNCRGNIFESCAYAIRNIIHRTMNLYQRYVHVTIVWSEFLRRRLLNEGFSPERTVVVPHPVSIPNETADPAKGRYVAYLGRLSPEKGIRMLLQAAERMPHIPFRLTGDPKGLNGSIDKVPENVEFVGWIDRTAIGTFLGNARFTILPSVCFETFPTAALESMSYGIPVIGSRIGGIPEAVLDGETGLLFETGNSAELADKIRYLWDEPRLCAELGNAGRQIVLQNYSADSYFNALLHVYELAIECARK